MRIGIGYDIHRFEEGRPLLLGGVAIPAARGLTGHSDADVLLHAIIDALLGAAGLGDIGQHFPAADPAYRGANSVELLTSTLALITEADLTVGSLDTTIIAESPRLAPYLTAMRERIAAALGTPASRVNVKAATNEGIGDLGRGEGIAAVAVALLDESL